LRRSVGTLGSDSDVIAMSLFYQTILQFVWLNGLTVSASQYYMQSGRSLSP